MQWAVNKYNTFNLFVVCVKSYQGNGTLVLSTGRRRYMMTVRFVIVVRVKLSSKDAWIESKRATASRWLCQVVFLILNIRNHNSLKFNNNNMKNITKCEYKETKG